MAPTEEPATEGPVHGGRMHTLAARVRAPRRPRLWFETVLIAVSYWTYSLIRNAVPEQRAEALRNADWIWDVERILGIAVEQSVNHAVNSVTWLIVMMNYYYATLHFIVTIGILVWLFRRHPGRYAAARLVLFATTGAALVGYYLYPLAPPRLMNGGGFIDTVRVHDTWGSMASGNLAEMSNQYAAMPSMHIGWSVWCGIAVVMLTKPLWAKALGVLYPTATLVVIVCTANHFWLDAVGGLLCLAAGFGISYVWYGRFPHQLPRRVLPAPAKAPVEPAAASPAAAGASLAVPGVSAGAPGAPPAAPGASPVTPGVQPAAPGASPVTPGVQPAAPGASPVHASAPAAPGDIAGTVDVAESAGPRGGSTPAPG